MKKQPDGTPKFAIAFAATIMSVSVALNTADIDISTPLNEYMSASTKVAIMKAEKEIQCDKDNSFDIIMNNPEWVETLRRIESLEKDSHPKK